MAPRVSVIIPNYNHAKFLEQRIESVLNQTFQDFELIILDDCSTDSSLAVIETYRDNTRVSQSIFNNVNSGSTFKQWETGIALAKGQFIWIAESDDFCDTNFLEVAIKNLEQKKTDLFVSKSFRVDESGNYIDKLEFWYEDLGLKRWEGDFVNSSDNELTKFLARKNTIVNASAVVFKNELFLIGHLHLIRSYKYCGDWLFWMLFLKISNKISYSVKTTNYFRTHSSTTRSSKNSERNKEVVEIYKWIFENVPSYRKNYINLKYIFRYHIIKHPKKSVNKNISLLFKLNQISIKFTLIMILYYINFKHGKCIKTP